MGFTADGLYIPSIEEVQKKDKTAAELETEDAFGSTAADMATPSWESAKKRFSEGWGSQAGVAGALGKPDSALEAGYNRAVGYFADMGLTGLDLVDAATNYAVGLGTELVPFQNDIEEERLATDIMGMQEAYLPETPRGITAALDEQTLKAGLASAKEIPGVKEAAKAHDYVVSSMVDAYDPTKVNIFGGLGAKNPPSSTFKKAEEADMLGATAEDTWKDTGWFRDSKDKQWRFEIDDSKAELAWDTVKPEITSQLKKKNKVTIDTTIGDVLKHDKLFEQYPELASTRLKIETINDGSLGYFMPSTGKIVLSDKLTQDQMKSTLLHEIQHAVQNKEGFASGANTSMYDLEPEVVEKASRYAASRDALQEAIANGESESRIKKLQDNVKQDWYEYDNMQYRFYAGKKGEIESRLVQYRMDMTPTERGTVSPQESEQAMLLGEHNRNAGAIHNLKGSESAPKKKAPIVVPVSETWNDTAKLHEVLGRDDNTRDILTWKPGQEFTIKDDFTGANKTVKFKSVELAPDTMTATWRDKFPEIKTSTGEYPVILYEDPDGYQGYVDVSTYLGDAFDKKNTADLRFGRSQAPMVTDTYDIMELPGENGYAKGGMVKEQMDEMMKDKVDPVSGNDIPPGAKAEEVRDDIDAKLSEGEYVVPADIVRYYGVAFFEKLRKKAKDGLAEMDSEGRIGGEPVDEEETIDDLPFDIEELEVEDDAMEGQMEGAGFAEGGVVGSSPATNPQLYGSGFSVFGETPDVTKLGYTTKTYVNAAGNQINIQFDASGNPVTAIPAGYYEQGTTPPKTTTTTSTTAATKKPAERPEGAGQREVGGTQTGSGGSGGSGYRSQDFAGMSSADAVKSATDRLAGAEKAGKIGAGIGTALGFAVGAPGLGAVAGKTAGLGVRVADALGVANIRESIGDTAGAKQIRDAVAKTTGNMKTGTQGILGVTAQGNWGKTAAKSATTSQTKEKGSGSSLAPTTSPRPQSRPAGLAAPAKGGSGGAQSGKGSGSKGGSSSGGYGSTSRR